MGKPTASSLPCAPSPKGEEWPHPRTLWGSGRVSCEGAVGPGLGPGTGVGTPSLRCLTGQIVGTVVMGCVTSPSWACTEDSAGHTASAQQTRGRDGMARTYISSERVGGPFSMPCPPHWTCRDRVTPAADPGDPTHGVRQTYRPQGALSTGRRGPRRSWDEPCGPSLRTGSKVGRDLPASIHPSICSPTTSLCAHVGYVALPSVWAHLNQWTETEFTVLGAEGQPGRLKGGVGSAAEASRWRRLGQDLKGGIEAIRKGDLEGNRMCEGRPSGSAWQQHL